MLDGLLGELESQAQPGFGIRVAWDNLECGYGPKCQALLDSSTANYISFIDDDDWVAPDFVEKIMDALRQRPDYVGFTVDYTEDGIQQPRVEHSLRHHGWHNGPDLLTRDLVHFNPIWREIAAQGRWTGGNGADARWAHQIRDLRLPMREVFIDENLYIYRHRMWDTFTAAREPLPDQPPQPDRPLVEWLP